MLHRNGKEIEQIFRNGREIALLYKNGVIIYDKRGHVEPTTSYTISYVNGENNQSITGNLPANETITTNTYTIPSTGTLSWTEHTLLGYSETQYPSYANIATSVYAPGDEITVNHNMTLYPVWSTTFQGLINEGFVDMTKDPSGLSDYTYIGVRPNHYPKELVTDFMDVFTNQKGITVSVNKGVITNTGTVAVDGTTCAFAFWRDTQLDNHWLTTDEWYDLFNERLFSTWPISSQFRYIDWSDKSSIHIKFVGQTSGAGWNCPQYLFGPTSPTVVTYELTNGYFGQTTQYLFGSSGIGCSSETINIVTSRPNAQNTPSSLNATFAGCRNLKTITGLNVSNSNGFPWAFDGCYAIETIPTLGANTWNMGTSTIQTFAHCYELETVTPILNVSNVTETKNTFTQCYELTNLQLNGINANKNKSSAYPNETYWVWRYDWDFTNTKLSQNSVDYMIQNLTEITIDDPSTFQYKTIGFPNNVTLSNSQITRLGDNGWIAYKNGSILTAIQ